MLQVALGLGAFLDEAPPALLWGVSLVLIVLLYVVPNRRGRAAIPRWMTLCVFLAYFASPPPPVW